MTEESNDFPLEIKELDSELNEAIKKHYGAAGHYVGYIQVGPSKYLMYTTYRQLAGGIYNMPLQSSDTFVVTYPRSGTTWTQDLVWLVLNDLDFAKAKSEPLTDRYVFLEASMFFDDKMREEFSKDVNQMNALKSLMTPGIELLAASPSPRFVKSHLPLSLLPPSLLDTTKVVYVARDPRDVVVSYYHFTKSNQAMEFVGDFNAFFDLFLGDLLIWSPFFAHVKEAWQQRNHPNMLFLFYEELIKDLAGTAQRVAKFFGKQYSQQQIATLAEHLHFDNFRNNKAVDLVNMREAGLFKPNMSFVRKGKSGGWREYMDAEQKERAERWMADHLNGTDLVFPDH